MLLEVLLAGGDQLQGNELEATPHVSTNINSEAAVKTLTRGSRSGR